MANSTPRTEINMHPKVWTGLLVGLGITVVTAVSAFITPDALAPLGVWAVPAAALATTGLATLGGWLKRVQSEQSNAASDASAPSEPVAAADADPAAISAGVVGADSSANPDAGLTPSAS